MTMAYTGFQNFLFDGMMVSGGHKIIRWLADFSESEGIIGAYGWSLANTETYRHVCDVGLWVTRKQRLVEDR